MSARPLSAVVVGGGPAGLAAAISLSCRGFEVTVLEQRKQSTMYEPQRAYNYGIDGRGQRCLDTLGLQSEFQARSVEEKRCIVTTLSSDGVRRSVQPAAFAGRNKCWISRQTLLALLYNRLVRQSGAAAVKLHFGTTLISLERTPQGGIELVGQGPNDEAIRLCPTLLVGADGISSSVRSKCAEWSSADPSLGATASDFTPVKLRSPSTGLCYKMMRLPPRFRLDARDPSALANPRELYRHEPASSGPTPRS